ncbi:hypothetical protein CS543_09510 [Porphyromonas gingivalis]|nr:hypothetical protein CS543_09510 [Porphyromonas gingivalis]PDP50116.1 hypothetical protein CLI77_02250 [Porphyromonas gingivalis]PDP56427.1 hypothetical protein CLI74_05860 [Porphyromonas gingivalis]PDP62885.1 hypothetical protein CLI83_03265 [Porphyromonas gingivalis]PDP75339.1 hypothetical protein CLI79_04650 [Porphyromonas gingivalis]
MYQPIIPCVYGMINDTKLWHDKENHLMRPLKKRRLSFRLQLIQRDESGHREHTSCGSSL